VKIFKFSFPLIFIVILASVLRLGLLAKHPVALNVDEVAIGYDAYSILNTGKDMHQKTFPLVFESLGDNKPGLYIYSVVLSEAIFGLNEFSVRIPAALAGIITVFVLYLTVKLISNNNNLAFFSALVLSLSPWHIKLSRGAFEANLALCLLLLGFYLTIKAVKEGRKMNWGLLFFALSMHAYHSEKVLAPLLIVSMMFVFRTQLISKKLLGWWLLTLVIAMSPFLMTLGGNNQSRLKAKLLDKDPEISIFLSRATDYQSFDKLVVMGSTVFKRYLGFLDFGYLNNKGLDLTSSSSFDIGWIYWLEFPFLIIGVFILFKKDIFVDKKYLYCFLLWLLISPIPASITMDDYHVYRLLTITIPFSIMVAVGINCLYEFAKNKKLINIFFVSLTTIYIINISYFFDYYLLHYPMDKSDWLFDPSKEVAMTVLGNLNNYDKIIVDPVFGKNGPYIYGVPDLYILFYGKINPREFWSQTTENGFKNIEFRNIDWNKEKHTPNNLLIGSTWSLSKTDIGNSMIKEIKFFNGEPAYFVAETNRK
jgi:4-amino-4-deoxy-L-arabinose transferase-like glycosyltransferase